MGIGNFGSGVSNSIVAEVTNCVKNSISNYKGRRGIYQKNFVKLGEAATKGGVKLSDSTLEAIDDAKSEIEAEQKGTRLERG